jgi:hypothetical protein
MPDEFYSGPASEGSSGPIITRAYHFDDLWPVGAHGDDDGGAKDDLQDGLHPVVAIGPNAAGGTKSFRPINITGVVTSCNDDAEIAQVNVAPKVVVRNYVANIDEYSGGALSTYLTSMQIGRPVYVDDSSVLSTGVTLSTSPVNDDGAANPLAGYLYYCQDEMLDSGIGGPNASAVWPKIVANELVEDEYCIMLVNDHGVSGLT